MPIICHKFIGKPLEAMNTSTSLRIIVAFKAWDKDGLSSEDLQTASNPA